MTSWTPPFLACVWAMHLGCQGPRPPPAKQSQGPESGGETAGELRSVVLFLQSPQMFSRFFSGLWFSFHSALRGADISCFADRRVVLRVPHLQTDSFGKSPSNHRIIESSGMNFSIFHGQSSFFPMKDIVINPLGFWGTSHCLWANARFLLVMSAFLLVNLEFCWSVLQFLCGLVRSLYNPFSWGVLNKAVLIESPLFLITATIQWLGVN